MSRARAISPLLVSALVAGWSPLAGAVPMVVNNLDPAGSGFNDPKPAAPIGGNAGTTVGQQRLNVFNRAAQMWSAALGGTVPIEINARFAPLDCSGGLITLGSARAAYYVAGGAGVPALSWVPVSLGNQLDGFDDDPARPEIEATFNGGLNECTSGRQDWYYGFDGQAGDDTDLLSVVLHELGHGLGFSSLVNRMTGVTPSGRFDTYAQHVYDVTAGQLWTAMTDAQRAASIQNVRNLSWQGTNVTRQAALILASGVPILRTTPVLPGLNDHISEADFGARVAAQPVTGPLRVGSLSPFTCAFTGTAAGSVVLITQDVCAPIRQAYNAQQAGAIAVILADQENLDPPATIDTQVTLEPQYRVTVPVIAVTTEDANALAAAPAGTTVQLSGDPTLRVGADAAGRALLYATRPLASGSTLSHWDVLARPDLLMEPILAARAPHDLRMELALLRDLGWTTTCGNGVTNPGEACDQGAQNGAPGSTCRPDCTAGGAPPPDAGPPPPDAALPRDTGPPTDTPPVIVPDSGAPDRMPDLLARDAGAGGMGGRDAAPDVFLAVDTGAGGTGGSRDAAADRTPDVSLDAAASPRDAAPDLAVIPGTIADSGAPDLATRNLRGEVIKGSGCAVGGQSSQRTASAGVWLLAALLWLARRPRR